MSSISIDCSAVTASAERDIKLFTEQRYIQAYRAAVNRYFAEGGEGYKMMDDAVSTSILEIHNSAELQDIRDTIFKEAVKGAIQKLADHQANKLVFTQAKLQSPR